MVGFSISAGLEFAELTRPLRFSSFFPQRPRRFAPDKSPGIFIVVGQASRLSV